MAERSDQGVFGRWRENARRAPDREAIVHWRAGEAPVRISWAALLDAAASEAATLASAGVRNGEVCALIMRHDPRFYPLYVAIVSLGAIPAVLAYPNARLHPDKFRQGIEGMARHSGIDWIVTQRDLEPTLAPLIAGAGTTIKGMIFPAPQQGGGASIQSPAVSPDQPALLQHSSGTTGLQKGVVLSHRAVLAHVESYARAIELASTDRIVSWLPLYHDMGLIAAFHLALAAAVPLVQLDPLEWVSAPGMFLEAVAGEGGTLAWLPNFAYSLMAARVPEEELGALRLDSLRLIVNCSEPVRAESHERFLSRFAPRGLRREALGACYAMAETTFAITQTKPGREARRLRLDRERLARGQAVPARDGATERVCVSSGAPIAGCEVRIVDASGRSLPDEAVGELHVRSVSLFDGYRNCPDKTAEALRDGWLRTGDLGFRSGDECFVIGRQKDLIIVAGKNLYPEDIEDVVSDVRGVIPGRIVAFGVDEPALGTEQVCVVVETEVREQAELRALRLAIVLAGMQIDVTLARVYFAPPRWLIKSSSGKPSRRANQDRALAELRPA